MKFPSLLASLLFLAPGVIAAPAESAASAEKSGYSLFQRTPRALMRELSTDRPDKTESAYTVDAGHFQIEMDLVTYTQDRDEVDGDDTEIDAWSAPSFNLKVGLTNRVDFQAVVETFSRVVTKDHDTDETTRQSGFGDIIARVKVNCWGNDGGKTALAVMPFVKFPTNQDDLGNDSTEWGVIVPLAVALPAEVGMGWMTEIDLNRDETGSGRHFDFVNSVTFSRDFTKRLGGYAELFGAIGTEQDSHWIVTLDLGLTYGITDNIQLDTGVNLGLTDVADDTVAFLGLTLRF